MARIALIKPFTGLTFAVSQLSGELRKRGHETIIVYVKDYYVVPKDKSAGHATMDFAGTLVGPRGREFVWNCITPMTEKEYELLFGVLKRFDPQAIGYSLTSNGIDYVGAMTSRVKERFDVPAIWGGSGPTLEPERCLKYADYVCVHEGDEVIVEIAERLDAGQAIEGITGLWSKRDGGVVQTPRRPLVDVETIAVPNYDYSTTFHIENGKLSENFNSYGRSETYPILTARGCPFSCSFCIESVYQDMFGKKGSLRRRSVDLVIQELVEAKKQYEIRRVEFWDDVFTTHRKWLQEFAVRYKQEVGLPFWCYTYPTTTRREDIALLKDAGCVSMTMGVQTGSQRILDEFFNRPAPLEKVYEAMQIILDAGLFCFFDFITHIEFETEEDVRATFEFLSRIPRGVQVAGFGHMVSFPTYGYSKQAKEHKHALSEHDYSYFHRLYYLAMTDLPTSTKQAIATSPLFRQNPELMERYLPASWPSSFFPPDDAPKTRYARPVVNTTIAQTVMAEESPGPSVGERARQAVTEMARSIAPRRKLPVFST